MIYWFKRHLGDKSPLALCNQFEQLFAKLGSPRGMMMVRSPGTLNVTLFIGLPAPDLVNAFAGFAPARVAEIPGDFACEIGNDGELRELRDMLKARSADAGSRAFSAPHRTGK